jgi:hypothetical protein
MGAEGTRELVGVDPDDKQAAIPHPICAPETLFHLRHFQLT